MDVRRHLLSLKCDPDRIRELRAEYPNAVLPGYYSDGRTWISVDIDCVGRPGGPSEGLVLDLFWLVGGFNPAIGAMRSVVNCVIAGVPALVAVVVAGTVLGNPTAVELVDSGKRALRRRTGRR